MKSILLIIFLNNLLFCVKYSFIFFLKSDLLIINKCFNRFSRGIVLKESFKSSYRGEISVL